MSDYLEIEALDTLIKAVQDYQEKLEVNKKILSNAANVCDQAMGSDAIVKKHIAKLEEAMVELNKTSQIASDVAEALIKDRNLAVSVIED